MSKDTEEIKNKQTEMNNKITEIKNILEGTSRRITEAEESISELKDWMVEITAKEQNKRKEMKIIEHTLRYFWDNIKHNDIWVIGIPEEEEKKKGNKKILKKLQLKTSPTRER